MAECESAHNVLVDGQHPSKVNRKILQATMYCEWLLQDADSIHHRRPVAVHLALQCSTTICRGCDCESEVGVQLNFFNGEAAAKRIAADELQRIESRESIQARECESVHS